jgi:inosine/xanthosine triphosphate pyrophosphatase family protein
MAIIVNTRNKKKEKIIKDFLTDMDVEFQTIVEEEEVPHKINPKKSQSAKEKKILKDIDQSVDFVNKYTKGKIKAKSLNDLLNAL